MAMRRTTVDGRKLGKPVEEVAGEESVRKSKDLKYVEKEGGEIARTIMPLGLEADEAVGLIPQKRKIVIRGLSPNRFNVLVAGIRSGLTRRSACKLAGIRYDYMVEWVKRGNEGEEPYTAIAWILDQAGAELERKLLNSLIEAGTVEKKYTEVTKETISDSDTGKEIVKEKSMEKVKFPSWGAALAVLERVNPEYRLENANVDDGGGNTVEEDLLMMDGTSLGIAKKEE